MQRLQRSGSFWWKEKSLSWKHAVMRVPQKRISGSNHNQPSKGLTPWMASFYFLKPRAFSRTCQESRGPRVSHRNRRGSEVCVCVHIYIYIYIFLHIYNIYIYVYICLHMYVYVYANIEMIYMNGSGIFLLTKVHSCTSTGPKVINVLIPTNQREREREREHLLKECDSHLCLNIRFGFCRCQAVSMECHVP